MTNPYRAMCAELVEAYAWCIEEYMTAPAEEDTLIQRARALLDQPVAEGPTDEELLRLAREWNSGFESIELHFAADYARAVLARWGHPTPQPEGGDIHYAWELHDAEGDWQAGGSADSLEDVQREGNRYLHTYSQDGPHKLIIQRHCVNTIEEVTND
jgi:hypothetical protein